MGETRDSDGKKGMETKEPESVELHPQPQAHSGHSRAGMAAVRRIIDVSGDGMTVVGPTLQPEEVAHIRANLGSLLRHGSEAADDGLAAVQGQLLAKGTKTLEETVAGGIGEQILGWVRGACLDVMGSLGAQIEIAERVQGWLEGVERVKQKEAEVLAVDAVILALKKAVRRQLDAISFRIAETSDQALWDLNLKLDPTKPLFSAGDAAAFAWLAFEERLRPQLSARDQVDRIRAIGENLRTVEEYAAKGGAR